MFQPARTLITNYATSGEDLDNAKTSTEEETDQYIASHTTHTVPREPYKIRKALLTAVLSVSLIVILVTIVGGILLKFGPKSISNPIINDLRYSKSAPAVLTASQHTLPAYASSTPFASEPSWVQNFSTGGETSLSATYWNELIGSAPANNEAEYYTDNPSNIHVANGKLSLVAQKQSIDGYRYTSARIDTQNKEDFQYGKIEVNAELPSSIGTWPAIWLEPTDNIYSTPDGSKAGFVNGEIDIAETVGTQAHSIYGVAHSQVEGQYYAIKTVPNSNTSYHIYGIEWTPTNLTFTIDNQPYFSVTKQANATYATWPYNQKFYLIINLALGGSWGGNDKKAFPIDGVDANALPASLNVKSVAYYPYTGPAID